MERTVMWTIEDTVNNITNKMVAPADGVITISRPDTARVNAYVNDAIAPTQQVNVKAGDTVYFKLTNYKGNETPIGIDYMGTKSVIMLPGMVEEAPVSKVIAVDGEPIAIISETTTIEEEDMTPQDTINLFGSGMGGGGTMGGAGAGLGAGLVGGLLGTALFGRRGLDGLDGGGAVAGATLRNPPEQNQANMDLMAGIGAVDKAVAVSQAAIENSNSMQTNMLSGQLSQVAQATVGQISGLKDVVNANSVALMQGQSAIQQNIMENRYELSKDISSDGEKTRALITAQYELNLQRQLADANAQIIELRGDNRLQTATNGINVTNTNNINQMQQQQQQQYQYGQLANMLWALGQNITNANSAINVGSGTQTSTPTNTNTNIR